MTQSNDDIKWLYGKLKSKGYNVGTEEEFSATLSNQEDRDWYYRKATEMGLNMGSKEDFESLYAPQVAAAPQAQYQQQTQSASVPEAETQPAPVQPAQTAQPKWRPSEQEKIQMAHGLNRMTQDYQERSQEIVEQTGRATERMTPEGRRKLKAAEFQARLAGTPTKVPGLTPPAQAPSTDGQQSEDGEQQKPVMSRQSPVPYGVKIVDGKRVTEWLLPDGRLTTNLMEADQAEYIARGSRLEHEFMGRMKQNGLDPSKPEDVQLQTAYERQREIETALTKRKQELDAEYEGAGSMTKIFRTLSDGIRSQREPYSANDRNYENDERYNSLMAALRNGRAAINVLEDKHRGKMNEFWLSMGKQFVDGYAFSGGMSELRDSRALTDASAMVDEINRKHKNGEKLTDEEQTAEYLLRSLAQRKAVEDDYTGEYGALARAGKMGAHSIELLPDFAMGGMSMMEKATGKVLSRMSIGAATNMMKKRLLKGTGVVLGTTAGGALMTNTIQLPRLMAETSKGMAGYVERDETGNYVVDGKEGLLTAIINAERELISENASEAVGAYIPGIGKALGRAMDKLGLSKLNGYVAGMKGTGWYKKADASLKHLGFNGTLNEGLEEYAGAAYSALMGDMEGVKSMTDLNTHIDIWLGCVTLGGILNAPHYIGTGLYGVNYAKQRHALARSGRKAQAEFGKELWDSIAGKLDETPNEDMSNVLLGLIEDNKLDTKQFESLLGYVGELQRMRGYTIGEFIGHPEVLEEDSERERTSEDNYTTAQETFGRFEEGTVEEQAAARADMEDIALRYREALEGIEDAFGAESEARMAEMQENPRDLLTNPELTFDQQDAVLHYINAKAALDGVRDAADESAEGKRRAVEKAVEDRTHHQNGVIQPVVLKFDETGHAGDREVYLVGGNVALYNDGTIDVTNSDSQLWYFDKESGALYPTSPDRIERIGETVDPRTELANALAEIDAQREMVENNLTSVSESVSLHKENQQTDGNGFEQDNDGLSTDDGGTVAGDPTSRVAENRDRSYIRVYEEGLSSEQNGNSEYGERTRRESEVQRLTKIALENGQYIPKEDYTKLGRRKKKSSGESIVFDNHENDGKVYKVKDPYAKSPMKGNVQPEDAIYEHLVHNKYFPETAYGFEGISDDMGDLRIVLSQDFIDAIDNATDEQIAVALAEKGLYPEGNYRYGNDEISVTDVTGDNALLGADGKVYFIDPIIDFKRPVSDILPAENVPSDLQLENKAGDAISAQTSQIDDRTGYGETDALSRVPVDANGKPQFTAVAPAVAWDAIVEKTQDDETAQTFADNMVRIREASLRKAEGAKPKLVEDIDEFVALENQRKEAIAQARAELDKWKRIAGVPQERRREQAERDAAEMASTRKVAETRYNAAVEEMNRKERERREMEREREEVERRRMSELEAERQRWEDSPAGMSISAVRDAADAYFQSKLQEVSSANSGAFSDSAMSAQGSAQYRREYASWGTPLSLDEWVARYLSLSSADKIRWSGKDGLAAQLTGRADAGERSDLRWMTSDVSGMSFGDYTHKMWETLMGDRDVAFNASEVSDHDLRNMVQDMLLRHPRSRDLYEEAMSIHRRSVDAENEDAAWMRQNEGAVRDEWYMSNFGLTEEEFNMYEEEVYRGLAELDLNDTDIINLTNNIADEYYGYKNEHGITDRGVPDGNGLLHGEQSDNSVGDRTAEGNGTTTVDGAGIVNEQKSQAAEGVLTEPTEAQKKAGNYKMEHRRVDGYDISIENKKGSVRRGKDANGAEWESEMHNDYGYIRGTEGVDGDHIDVFLSDTPEQGDVFVVDQYNPDGSFDEHKVMYGFADGKSAMDAYLANYEQGWEQTRRLDVTGVSKEEFKKWIQSSKRKTKPFKEYKNVKAVDDTNVAPSTAEKVVPATQSAPYTITPSSYTNKKGKETPMHRLEFGRELTKEEESAVKKFASEKHGEGRFAPARGWKDRENGGWLFRTEEDARKAGELIGNEEAVADAQPLSREDIASEVRGQSDEVKGMPKKAPINRVSVEDLAESLHKNGEARLSDHAEPIEPKPEVQITDEMEDIAKQMRDILGADDSEVGGVHFRDPDELKPEQKRKLVMLGIDLTMRLFDQGKTDFPTVAKVMVGMVGEKIKPWIKAMYKNATIVPGYEDMQFTSDAEIDRFDIANFDKPSADVMKQAEMIVAERKAREATAQAEKELIESRNKKRKEHDKQTEAGTAALGEKAEAVASKAESLAETSADRDELNRAAEEIDDTLDEVNEQLALLGYYEADMDDSKFHESYGYMLTAEKKAVTDATNLAKQLVNDLGLDIKVTGATTPLGRNKVKKGTSVRANLAPAGGDITIALPLQEGRELRIYIGLDPVAERGTWKRGDNLAVNDGIMYRVENPNGSGMERYGHNCYADKDVTYAKLLDLVKREAKDYLPKPEQSSAEFIKEMSELMERGESPYTVTPEVEEQLAEQRKSEEEPYDAGGYWDRHEINEPEKNGFKVGEKVWYTRNDGKGKRELATIVDFGGGADVTLDTGMAPVMYEACEWSQIAKQEPTKDGIFGEAKRVAEAAKAKREVKKTASSPKKQPEVKPEQPIGDLFSGLSDTESTKNQNNGKERDKNSGTDYSGAESERKGVPESEQMAPGASIQNPATDIESKRRRLGNGSSESGTRPRYDVNRDYTNEEIHKIASTVTAIKDGKVIITGDVTDDIKAVCRQYQSGGIAKKGRGILDEYYTDGKIVDAVRMLISPYCDGKTARILEPSVGTGNFADAWQGMSPSEIVAFEINETTARIAKILHPEIDVKLRSFETEFIDDSGNKKPLPKKFDLIVGNPPYGSHRGFYKGLGEESKISRYEDYFVKRSLDILEDGGILAMVLPSSWIDRHTKYGGYTVEMAYRLPSGAFESTQVGTDIVVLRKDSSVPMSEHLPYFEGHPENICGEVKQRTGRFGKPEDYVAGSIDSAIEKIERGNAMRLADKLAIEKTNDNLNEIQSAIEETGDADKAATIVKETEPANADDAQSVIMPAQTGSNSGKYKVKLNKDTETAPTSRQFRHTFSEGEVEAFEDTNYDGTLDNPSQHSRYANYIGGKAVHDFYYAEGDIYSKLEQLEQDKESIIGTYGKEQYEKQKRLLESVLPKRKEISEITISPNTTFVKNLRIHTPEGNATLRDLFIDFCRKLPRQAFGSSSSWEVTGYVRNEQVYGQDKHRNQLVRERRKRVANDLFVKFLNEELSEAERSQVVYAFNREYNSTYRPNYSKVPMFSTINKDFKGRPLKLTSVQLAGVGRMTVKGVGVLAHEVGFGKTLSGVLAMHEAMTRGFAKKPLVVVPNDNILKQWVETIGEVLPDATVNTLGNLGANYDLTDFRVNDFEFTIVTYEGLKAMSFRDDTYDRLSDRFSYIMDDLKKHQSERDAQKAIEKRNELKGKMKRGTKPTYGFEDFGFDYLTFDEVHNANHIVSKVRLDKSIASDFRSQSQRTSDLGIKTWLAAQYIQEMNNGRNVLLLSATPFTNKPLEYYSILSLVGNDMLRRKGFFNVDQFFSTFMEADNELEIGANGRPVQKTNVRRFRNNGLFRQLLSEFIDIKGEEDNPDLVRPERHNREYRLKQNDLTAEAMTAVQEMLSDNDTVLQGIGHARAAAFSPYATPLLGLQPKDHRELVENSPKIDATVKMIEQNRKDRPDAGQIIYSEVGVEFFPMIRDYLVKESGFKPEEVRIITGATSNAERVNIQTAFNNGEVKVVIGSPAIKEGLNLQGNTTDMYILSLPWNFTQLRQIEGRGWRQGNRWDNIRINYMLTDDSVDVFMLQRLQTKQDLYNEAMKRGAESVDVSDIDTAELKTALITDPAVRAEIVTMQERAKLNQEKTQVEADLAFVMRKYKTYNELMEETDKQRILVERYGEYAKKEGGYWDGAAKDAKRKLAAMMQKIEEEKQRLLEKGINVDDIVRKAEQSQKDIESIDEKIGRLEDFERELAEKYRHESQTKERGDALSSYLDERKKENLSGFYSSRQKEESSRPTDGDKTKFRDGETDGERLLAIRELKPIDVKGNSLSKEELQEVYRNLPSVEKDGREMKFYHSAFKKIYREGGLFGQIVPVLDEVLEQSVLAYSDVDGYGGMIRQDGTVHKEHPNTISFDNYVGKVNIAGEEYYVRTTIQNDKGNQSGMHSCFVTNVEVYKNTAGETTSTEIPRVKSAADGIVDAKLLQFFERASAELLPHDMRQRAMELSNKLNTPIRLVDSADEALDNPSARHRRAKGWVTDKGEIVIVVPNNVNVADIENTVVHEIVGHYGLETLIGPERMDEFVTEVYGHAGQGIKKKIDARADKEYSDDIDRMTRQNGGGVFARAEATVEANAKKRAGHYQREATKEYMADIAGEIGDKGFERMSRDEQTLWGKIKVKVQQFLDKFLRGLKIAKNIRLTDKDLAYILYKAWKHKRENGVFAKAEDAVMRRKTSWGEAPLVEVSAKYRESFRETVVEDKIESLFDEAVAGKLTGKPVEVGRLTADGKAYLEKLSGKQMKDVVSFMINPSDMVHIYRRHFGKNEKDGRNYPLTKVDIRMMHTIVCNPDRVLYGVEKNGQSRGMFFFLKDTGEGSYNLMEVYSDSKGNLTAKSFFKSKEGVSQRAMLLHESSTLTSVTDGATLLDDAKVLKSFEYPKSEDETEIYSDRKGNLTAKTFYKTKKAVSQRVLSLKKSEHLTSVTDGANLSDAKLPKFFEYPKSEDEPQYRFRDGDMELEENMTKSRVEEWQKRERINDIHEEELRILTEAKERGDYMLAPNRQPSNLDSRQWVQVRTRAFKEWFGDWMKSPETASKMVDANGEPMVFYHGSGKEFREFKHGQEKFAGIKSDQIGFYFGTKEGAMQYEMGDTPHLYACFLNVRNPYWTDSHNVVTDTSRFMLDMSGIDKEHDGIVLKAGEEYNRNSEIAVFNPNQIKSATGNNGGFSKQDNDIYLRPGNGNISDEEVSMANDPWSKAWGGSIRGKRVQREFAARERERMTVRANEIAAKLNLDNVEIVTDVSGLEGKRATAKGFYNRGTERITIVIPNHESVADVESTMLHEAVAHYGLRRLFGASFDEFLDKVYRNADEDIRKSISEIADKNGYDIGTATEEYLGGLAEETDFDTAKHYGGWWSKVKRLFMDMLRKLGLRAFDKVEISDNELRYMLWRSYENLRGRDTGILGIASDMVKQRELKVGNYADGTPLPSHAAEGDLYRDGNDIVAKRPVLARAMYEHRVASSTFQVREAMQDSMLGLKELYNAIDTASGNKRYIEDVPDFQNAYVAENLMSSRNQAEQMAYEKLVIKPMLDEVVKLAPDENTYGELLTYLMAKHGLERNALMRDQAKADGMDSDKAEATDFAGLTGLFMTDDVVDAESQAEQLVSDYEVAHDTTKIWDKVNAATKATLSKLKEGGLMSKESHDKIADMYDNYIPLRGWSETTTDEVYGYVARQDSNLRGSVLKTANGRTSIADDPIATIMMMGEQAIAQANRNKMKQAFLTYVMKHPSDLVSVNQLWLQKNDITDAWEPVFASNINESDDPATVERKISDFEDTMKRLAAAEPDKYKSGRQAKGIPYKIGNGNLVEHTVLVKRGDYTYVVTINGNPRAAQALNGLTNPDVGTGVGAALFGLGEKINHIISPIYTTRNPDFIVGNFFRDAFYGNTMAWIKESPKYATRLNWTLIRVNPVKMAKLISRYNANKLDMNNQLERQFHEFIMNGGETGYTNQADIEKQKKRVKIIIAKTKRAQF